MTPNPHRGEVSLTLGEREVILRPTFAALVAIERETGMGLMALGRKLAQGSIEHVPAIIREIARASGDEIDRAVIEDQIMTNGVMSVLEPAAAALARAIGGNDNGSTMPPDTLLR